MASCPVARRRGHRPRRCAAVVHALQLRTVGVARDLLQAAHSTTRDGHRVRKGPHGFAAYRLAPAAAKGLFAGIGTRVTSPSIFPWTRRIFADLNGKGVIVNASVRAAVALLHWVTDVRAKWGRGMAPHP